MMPSTPTRPKPVLPVIPASPVPLSNPVRPNSFPPDSAVTPPKHHPVPENAAARCAALAIVEAALPNARFRVRLATGERILVHASGPMRIRSIRVLPGDVVSIERSPFDPTMGRIVVPQPRPQRRDGAPQATRSPEAGGLRLPREQLPREQRDCIQPERTS